MIESQERNAPVTGRARIDVLDVLRGLAILGIFYMNIQFMGTSVFRMMNDIRSVGWSPADQTAWWTIQTFMEGTQRGLLELLFGAGVMVLARRAMVPDGPVAVADLHYRRNLWLLAFGLIDVFVILWPGDILHVYAIAALFLFPFRLLHARWLLALGLAFAAFSAIGGAVQYAGRIDLTARVEAAATHKAPDARDRAARAEWQKLVDYHKVDAKEQRNFKEEDAGHAGPLAAYAGLFWHVWTAFVVPKGLLFGVVEAFCVMLIGMALWRWRIIQGDRSVRFYGLLLLGCYGFGLVARGIGAAEVMTFTPIPKSMWITAEPARIAVSVGHVALVNLLMQQGFGRRLLSPFKAAGRVAFSLYFLESIIGMWLIFAPWGLNWWRGFGYAGLAGIATAVIAVLLVVANLWVRAFAMGPLEWAWRSLSYAQRQPFRRRPDRIADPLPEPGALPV